jgi:acyl transferase domain-containing protein
VLTGTTRTDLLRRLDDVRQQLDGETSRHRILLADGLDAPSGFRLALVATDIADLKKRVRFATDRLVAKGKRSIHAAEGVYYAEPETRTNGKLAILLPGEGSQYVGMLSELVHEFGEVRDVVAEMEGACARDGGVSLRSLVAPDAALAAEAKQAVEKRLWEMEGAVLSVLTADLAFYRLLAGLGLRADAVLGHSTGEFAALMIAGAVAPDGPQRSAFIKEFAAIPASVDAEIRRVSLFAVAASAAEAIEAVTDLAPDVQLGMDNCPHQSVIVAVEPAAAKVAERLQTRGLLFERLRFDRPYHTPLFQPYDRHLRAFLERWISALPSIETYNCTSAAPFPRDLHAVRQLATEHWSRPVRFRETIERMYADGIRVFVEAGARGNLTGFVGDILRGRTHLAMAANVSHRSARLQLCHLVAALVAHQIPISVDRFVGERSVASTLTPECAPMSPDLDHPAVAASKGPDTTPSPFSEELDHLAQAMAGHQQLMSEFLTMHHDVMRRYLAAVGGAGRDFPLPAAELVAVPQVAGLPALVIEPPATVTPSKQSESTVASSVSAPGFKQMLLRIVSERTGYPVEMLDLNLDMEAELGIDSIKRVEILAAFQQQTSVTTNVEALAACKTLRDVVALLPAHVQ